MHGTRMSPFDCFTDGLLLCSLPRRRLGISSCISFVVTGPGLVYSSAGDQALHNASTNQDELSLETALIAFSTSELVEKLCLVGSEGHGKALRAENCGDSYQTILFRKSMPSSLSCIDSEESS